MVLTLTFIMTLLITAGFFYLIVGRVFFAWLRWVIKGRPYITYEGYHCGLCRKWMVASFAIREYESEGEWMDTWGICKECIRVKRDGPEIVVSFEKPLQDETNLMR